MQFNKSLLLCSYLFVSLFIAGCGTTAEKSSTGADGTVAHKSGKKNASADNVPAPTGPSTALPAGPATPNPYLQNPPKISEQVDTNFRNAVAYIQQKNWAGAEALLKSLAQSNPTLSGVHLNLGIVYRNKGDAEKAMAEFNSAITANAKNVDAYNQLAVMKREAGDFSTAESLYVKALAIWPFYPEGHKNIAILYDLYMGKSEQALPHYVAYQQLLPAPDKQVDSWIADLQRRLNGGKNADKAEAK